MCVCFVFFWFHKLISISYLGIQKFGEVGLFGDRNHDPRLVLPFHVQLLLLFNGMGPLLLHLHFFFDGGCSDCVMGCAIQQAWLQLAEGAPFHRDGFIWWDSTSSCGLLYWTGEGMACGGSHAAHGWALYWRCNHLCPSCPRTMGSRPALAQLCRSFTLYLSLLCRNGCSCSLLEHKYCTGLETRSVGRLQNELIVIWTVGRLFV